MTMRIDELLVAAGLTQSRAKARAIIEEGKVFVNGNAVDKPSRKFPEDADVRIASDNSALRYVSRAGLKLEKFLDHFKISLQDMRVLDAGASTGGFTHCALERGAAAAVCVDIGSGQLHAKLRADPRVESLEKTDVRALSPETFGNRLFDFVCADLSFISLEKVLPFLAALLKPKCKMACLIKPQFETPPGIMRRNKGVIKDAATKLAAVEKIKNYARQSLPELEILGVIPSPIRGGDGNEEFLIGFAKK